MILEGRIDRRILVNYRVRPEVAAALLPAPFRPRLVTDWAVAGICLLRLKQLRPKGLPAYFGVSSENAAYRFAVEWDDTESRPGQQTQVGVYIPRRETGSRLNAWAGGRLFPGTHHLIRFDARSQAGSFSINVFDERQRETSVALSAEAAPLIGSELFADTDDAAEFFRSASAGYSPAAGGEHFDGIELQVNDWNLMPLRLTSLHCPFYDECDRLPPGSIQFDSAFLMQNVEHSWIALPPLSARRPTNRIESTQPAVEHELTLSTSS
jgi:hypothetical protein